MRSARRAKPAAAALTACALLVAAPLGGCSTTREKAAAKQAESERILEKRERKRHAKAHDHRSEQR